MFLREDVFPQVIKEMAGRASQEELGMRKVGLAKAHTNWQKTHLMLKNTCPMLNISNACANTDRPQAQLLGAGSFPIR